MSEEQLEIGISSQEELPSAARRLLDFAGPARVLLFYAPMGAGKTTFIKSICRALGSVDNFSSPTYSVVNEYRAGEGKIYHFDLYRLRDAEELLDLGIEEYLASGQYCLFEWPGLVEDLVEGPYVRVDMEANPNFRYIRATKF